MIAANTTKHAAIVGRSIYLLQYSPEILIKHHIKTGRQQRVLSLIDFGGFDDTSIKSGPIFEVSGYIVV